MLNPDGVEVETFEKNGKTYVKEPVFFPFGIEDGLLEEGVVLYSGEIEGEPAYYCEIEHYKTKFLFKRRAVRELI